VRAEVRQVSQELGYRPNPLVAALIRSRRNPGRKRFHATLGYLTPQWPKGERAYRRDYKLLLDGARAHAAEFGYGVEALPLGAEEMPPERLAEILTARMIAGLILPPLHERAEMIALDWARWPLVAIGYSQRISVHRVVHDHAHALGLAVSQCRARGRRRVGLVLPQRVSEKVEHRWVAAFLQESWNTKKPDKLLPALLLDERDDEASFVRWRRRHLPDAIIGLPHLTPIEAWLAGDALAVPRDVAVVSLDHRTTGPKYAGIDQDYAQLGGMAVELLVGLVEQRGPRATRQPTITMVRGVWRDARSL
jgi:LacI family transcriptional regulator